LIDVSDEDGYIEPDPKGQLTSSVAKQPPGAVLASTSQTLTTTENNQRFPLKAEPISLGNTDGNVTFNL
jgi:hypothetical protein